MTTSARVVEHFSTAGRLPQEGALGNDMKKRCCEVVQVEPAILLCLSIWQSMPFPPQLLPLSIYKLDYFVHPSNNAQRPGFRVLLCYLNSASRNGNAHLTNIELTTF